MSTSCPVCNGIELRRILEIADVPVFCNIQLDTREEALSQPIGDMTLEYCPKCSHVFNSAFNEGLLSYSEAYENSLHYSATFNAFAHHLAQRLVERYALKGKKVVDIGCGKGDFLSLICELGSNDGHGFDKSYEAGRVKEPENGSIRFYPDFFSQEYDYLEPDMVICRHVLEHIRSPREFLGEIVAAIGKRNDCAVYFEVPNVLFTIRDMGIWDLIYEHCQYFSAHSLMQIFADTGIATERLYECFGGQFLAIEGIVQAGGGKGHLREGEVPVGEPIADVAGRFDASFRAVIDTWQGRISSLNAPAVVWGAGSKGTTFLNLLRDTDRIAGIVDINPHKQGKFTPCTGHAILAPESLRDIQPQDVFVMNPMYRDEIESAIAALGIDAVVHIVE